VPVVGALALCWEAARDTPPFSILCSVLYALRLGWLQPGGMDTQNWKAMFADRESDDDKNQWIYLGVLGLR
jgi:hypothetical protein